MEANPRAGETLAVGSGIDLEHLGGFLAGEVEDIAQHVGDAQLPIEAEQHRLRASEAHFARESLLFRVGPLGNLAESRPQPFVQRLERDRFPAPSSNSRQVVRRNPPHPRPERALAAERSEMREDDDEDLLCGVLRVGGVTQHAKRKPVDVVLNRLEDRVGRDLVPLRRGSRSFGEVDGAFVAHRGI